MRRPAKSGVLVALVSVSLMAAAHFRPPTIAECRVITGVFMGQVWAQCAATGCDPLAGVCTHLGGHSWGGFHDWFVCDCNGVSVEQCRGAFRSLGNGNDDVICFNVACPTGSVCVEQIPMAGWCDACLCTAPQI